MTDWIKHWQTPLTTSSNSGIHNPDMNDTMYKKGYEDAQTEHGSYEEGWNDALEAVKDELWGMEK